MQSQTLFKHTILMYLTPSPGCHQLYDCVTEVVKLIAVKM